jgi:hypothetical protein
LQTPSLLHIIDPQIPLLLTCLPTCKSQCNRQSLLSNNEDLIISLSQPCSGSSSHVEFIFTMSLMACMLCCMHAWSNLVFSLPTSFQNSWFC